MTKYAKAVAVFVLVEVVLAGLFWLGGYDFDRRGADVGWSALLAIYVGGFAAGFMLL